MNDKLKEKVLEQISEVRRKLEEIQNVMEIINEREHEKMSMHQITTSSE